jgi:hypothetical protein
LLHQWASLSSDKNCERSSRVIRYSLVARARVSSLAGLPLQLRRHQDGPACGRQLRERERRPGLGGL